MIFMTHNTIISSNITHFSHQKSTIFGPRRHGRRPWVLAGKMPWLAPAPVQWPRRPRRRWKEWSWCPLDQRTQKKDQITMGKSCGDFMGFTFISWDFEGSAAGIWCWGCSRTMLGICGYKQEQYSVWSKMALLMRKMMINHGIRFWRSLSSCKPKLVR